MTFELKLELGSEDMQSPEDVATMLLVAHDMLLIRCAGMTRLQATHVPHLLQVNGKSVGKWEVLKA